MRACTRAALAFGLALLAGGCASDIALPEDPVTVLPTADLVIPLGVDTTSLPLRNAGNAPLHWSLEAPAEATWLTITPAAGTLAPGDSLRVHLRADRAPVSLGLHTLPLVLRSDAWPGVEPIALAVPVGPDPRATLIAADTLIAFPGTDGTLTVRNDGKGNLELGATSTADWLRILWVDGNSAFNGNTLGVRYRIDRPQLPRDTSATIVLTVNDTTRPSITVRVNVQGTPAYRSMPLGFAATQATGYSETLWLAGERTLARLHTPSGTLQPLTLPADVRVLDTGAGGGPVVSHAGGYTSSSGQTQATPDQPGAISGWYGSRLVSYLPLETNGTELVSVGQLYPYARQVVAWSGPPLEHLAGGPAFALYGSFADGLVRFATSPSSQVVAIEAVIEDVPFAAEHRRFWFTPLGLITSSGAILATGSTVADHPVMGQLSWPGALPAPAIRHLSSSQGIDAQYGRLHVVREGSAGGPAPAMVWEYDAALGVDSIPLPPVEVAGVSYPVEPFAVFHVPARRELLVLQRVLGPGGTGAWSVVALRR